MPAEVEHPRLVNRALVALLLFTLLTGPVYEIILLSPFGFSAMTLLFFPLGFALMATGFASTLGLLCAPFFLFRSKFRKEEIYQSLLCAAILAATVGGIYCTREIRHNAFVALAERSKPLVRAIEDYEKANHRPPYNLGSLIPKYFAKIPRTGIGAYPDYEYKDEYCGSRWELSVPCSLGLINGDEFFYWPTRDYPESRGGGVERIGEWGYIHE